MNPNIKNPEFVKRMIVDADNLKTFRDKFWSGQELTNEEMSEVLKITPVHKEINWGPDRITMIPWTGIEHVQKCIEDTVMNNIEGDFVETGAWRGGTCIFAKSVYDTLGSSKNIFVADSFEGLPPPDLSKYPDDANDTHYLDENMKASLETVKDNFNRFGLLDDRVIFLKGWFKDTLPTAPVEKISILRLDGDMYESTIDALQNLYSKLSTGGYLVIDDYHHAPCRKAIFDFRYKNNITEKIQKVDSDPRNEIHYWVKKKDVKVSGSNCNQRNFMHSVMLLLNEICFYAKKAFLKVWQNF